MQGGAPADLGPGPGHPPRPRILDAGRIPGTRTPDLAEPPAGRLAPVDLHLPSLQILRKKRPRRADKVGAGGKSQKQWRRGMDEFRDFLIETAENVPEAGQGEDEVQALRK
ncbi:MAG TPA: hypothetical protein DCS11_08220 [Syntrophus sp. (in: bacteria)]|nr:hypothetical protein [Syntrophus sp. (in: bacteria)]